MASGTTAFLDSTLGYFRGNNVRSIRLDGTGSLPAYPGYIYHPAPGGVANVDAKTNVGRVLTLGVAERFGYEPFFNVFSPGSSGVPLPPADAWTPTWLGLESLFAFVCSGQGEWSVTTSRDASGDRVWLGAHLPWRSLVYAVTRLSREQLTLDRV